MTALKEVLEGKPIRSPIHPAIVHLPIALLPLSVALDVASRIVDNTTWPLVPAAFISLLAGIGTAVVAAIFGFVDYTDIRDDRRAKRTATAHMILNLVAVGLFAGSAGLRFGALHESQTPTLALIISVAALAILGYSGYLGGVLVYDEGIGVGRHRRHTRTPEGTVTLATSGKPVSVGNESDLKDGETLRVSIDGVIMTIARCGKEVFAVQEFCTHRFGPLSEGRVANCVVTCPWHNSKFDLRTGKATEGPAKVPLKTFRIEARDGKLWVYPPPRD